MTSAPGAKKDDKKSPKDALKEIYELTEVSLLKIREGDQATGVKHLQAVHDLADEQVGEEIEKEREDKAKKVAAEQAKEKAEKEKAAAKAAEPKPAFPGR